MAYYGTTDSDFIFYIFSDLVLYSSEGKANDFLCAYLTFTSKHYQVFYERKNDTRLSIRLLS